MRWQSVAFAGRDTATLTGGASLAFSVPIRSATGKIFDAIADEAQESTLPKKCAKAYFCYKSSDDKLEMIDKLTAQTRGCDFRTLSCSSEGRIDTAIDSCVPFEPHFCTDGTEILSDVHVIGTEPICPSGFTVLNPSSSEPVDNKTCISIKGKLANATSDNEVLQYLIFDLGYGYGKNAMGKIPKIGSLLKASTFLIEKGFIPTSEDATIEDWGKCLGMGGTQKLVDMGVKTVIPSSSLPFKDQVVKKTYAQVPQENDKVLYFPTPGVYKVSTVFGEQEIVSEGNDTRAMYLERNGVPGYQAPRDLMNPQDNEDVFISYKPFEVSVAKEITAQNIELKQGMNVISFDFAPSQSGEQNLGSHEFLRIVNKDVNTVSHITYFSGGQWSGGTTYDYESKEAKGEDFEITFGKGYAVLVVRDGIITVPGYNLESQVPIAFSSGWNLIGVHGHDTQYTAKSLINSVNSIEGLKANNVTYWPTSKGMYQGFQLSEGQEYGQDFPISKDLGYFVRINEIKEDCRSIWWNPGGEKNGECE